MRIAAALAIAALGLTTARVARTLVAAGDNVVEAPYAPSATAAPFASLGFREAMADVLFIRLAGYFGSREATAHGMAPLVEAVVALDPQYQRIYEYGAMAMTVSSGATQDIYLRAIAVLERGIAEFPRDWKLPNLAGQIYTQDLQSTDPAQQRAWNEKGLLLVESSLRKPGASPEAATWAATMRTKLGQHERAVRELREMILLTPDPQARERMIAKLNTLEKSDQAELAAELYEHQKLLEGDRKRHRPSLPSTMYILVGPRASASFDLADLATGGADLVGSAPVQVLEPL